MMLTVAGFKINYDHISHISENRQKNINPPLIITTFFVLISGARRDVRGGFQDGRWVLADFHVPFIFCPYDIIKSCSPISTLGGVLKSDF